MGIIHCFINVLIVWVIKLVFGPSKKSVILTAAFTMVRTYIVKLDVYLDTNIYIYILNEFSIHMLKLMPILFARKCIVRERGCSITIPMQYELTFEI